MELTSKTRILEAFRSGKKDVTDIRDFEGEHRLLEWEK